MLSGVTMALYFLSFELKRNKNNKKLREELHKHSAQKILTSLWSLETNDSNVLGLVDRFSSCIHKGDRLLVTESKGWAGVQPILPPKK